jgi:hypothetical protein
LKFAGLEPERRCRIVDQAAPHLAVEQLAKETVVAVDRRLQLDQARKQIGLAE